jgi:septal ring factor EnvC (AmiA/AmiB activator)
VEKVIAEDSRLRKQLEPVENKLNELKPNAKQNKADITALKKEISRIEKERKKLADQMKDDRKELSSYLKQLSDKNQDSVGERFTDIIENINYSFQEKLSL